MTALKKQKQVKAKLAAKPPLRGFRVYFSQINQERYNVRARSREKAIDIAMRQWQRDYRWPSVTYVEDESLAGERG